MEAQSTRRHLLKATTALAAVALLTACGGGGQASTSGAAGPGGIANEIKLMGVYDTTGPVAYAGVGASKGMKLAMDEIQEQGFLGKDVKITLDEADSAGSIERASSEVSRAIANPEINAIFGPVSGQQAATVAPMVEKAGVPTIFNQAGSDGVVIGDYTFRGTAPMHSYYDIGAEYLADKGLTNVAVLYNGTLSNLRRDRPEGVPQARRRAWPDHQLLLRGPEQHPGLHRAGAGDRQEQAGCRGHAAYRPAVGDRPDAA